MGRIISLSVGVLMAIVRTDVVLSETAQQNGITKTGAHLLDRSSVHYTPGQKGVTATVKMPGTSQTHQITLIPEQFTDAMVPMGPGQFEQGGMTAHLARAAKGEVGYSEAGHRGTGIVQSMDAPTNSAGRGQAGYYPGSGNRPALKGQFNEYGHWLGRSTPQQSFYSPELEARSTAIFGRGNVNAEPARQRWMSARKDVKQAQDDQPALPGRGLAESVYVKYRGEVDLKPFACSDIARSSFIGRVCYDRPNEYMLISLNGTYYHYCEIDAGTVSSLLTAPSMGRFYNASIKGAFDCRIHRVPSY